MKNKKSPVRHLRVAGGLPEERDMIAAVLYPDYLPAETAGPAAGAPDLAVVLPGGECDAPCPTVFLVDIPSGDGRRETSGAHSGARQMADRSAAGYPVAELPRICSFDALRETVTALMGDVPVTAAEPWRLTGRILSRGALCVRLTAAEGKAVACLLAADEPVSAEALAAAAGIPTVNATRVMLTGLRRKLGTAFGDGVLVSLRGRGYRLPG